MPHYGIAFLVAVVLFFVLCFMQEMMRQQVHHARFGNQEIGPWDVRFSSDFAGQYGIWKQHRRAYERSGVRFSFVVVSAALVTSIFVGICDFLYVRFGG